MYKVVYSKLSQKDADKLKGAGLSEKARDLISILEKNPLQSAPPYKSLRGNLKGVYSRRINIKHRLVYSIYETEKIVKVHRMWSHYE